MKRAYVNKNFIHVMKNDQCHILKRHVNFVKSAADEETHLDQDVLNCYYSAVCLLLSDSYSRKSIQFWQLYYIQNVRHGVCVKCTDIWFPILWYQMHYFSGYCSYCVFKRTHARIMIQQPAMMTEVFDFVTR